MQATTTLTNTDPDAEFPFKEPEGLCADQSAAQPEDAGAFRGDSDRVHSLRQPLGEIRFTDLPGRQVLHHPDALDRLGTKGVPV